MRFSTPALLLFLCVSTAQAQNIGINLTGVAPAASAMLDVDNANKGMLVPRVALSATNSVLPITGAMANSLLVYNTVTAGVAPTNVTPGFYYYQTSTSTWIPILSGVKGWTTTGNSGTVAGTNFIGTIDNIDFVLKTQNLERLRVLGSNGSVSINNPVPVATDRFSVYGGATAAGRSIFADGSGVGSNTIWAQNTGATGRAIIGISSLYTGVQGQGTSGVAGFGAATGVVGLGTGAASDGVYGEAAAGGFGTFGFNSDANGTGVVGLGNNGAVITTLVAGSGLAANGTGTGGLLFATTNTGTGAVIAGQNVVAFTNLAGGCGAAISGKGVGGFGYAQTAVSGIGLLGVGNNGTIIAPVRGAGVVGSGKQYGVMGFATTTVPTNYNSNSASNAANAAAGGYFEVQSGGTAQTWAYVGVQDGTSTLRKIIGPGTVNTIVKDLKGELVALSCPEAPENLFQDYGAGQLVDGKAHIELDPILAKNIVVNEKHPLRVFVQLEGDCKGVYVSNKSGTGFDVTELAGGTSTVAFTYTVAANRADEVLPDGSISRYSAERFPAAPGPIESHKLETTKAETRTTAVVRPAAIVDQVKGTARP
ncbi:MAG: hypothetical protein ACOH13_13275 [Flavobacteriales bacterium]